MSDYILTPDDGDHKGSVPTGEPAADAPIDTAAEVARRLHPEHAADLRGSDLSDATILANDYRDKGPLSTGHYLRRTSKAFVEALGVCLAIPFFNTDGTVMTCLDRDTGEPIVGKDGKPIAFVRFKPLPKNRRVIGGKPVKYESAYGVRNRPYFPVCTRAKLADSTVPVFFTEGEKKAAKADQEGYATIGLVGVYGWLAPRPKGPGGKKVGVHRLMDDLACLPWKGRKVYVVFDSDLADNVNVQWAEYKLAQALRKLGAEVRVIRLPAGPGGEKVGLDDFLKAHGKTEFEKLCAAARRPARPGTKRTPPRKPGGAADSAGGVEVDVDDVPPGDDTPADGKKPRRMPEIYTNGVQYRKLETSALHALVAANEPPTVFVGNGGCLSQLYRPEPGKPLAVRTLNPAALRPVFAQVADWIRCTNEGPEPDFPPAQLLASFPTLTEWPGIPHLRAILSYPAYGPKWSKAATQGYHAASGMYCDLNGLVVPPVPDVPTPEQVDEAKRWILEEMLYDFPFADDGGASRANAVAMLVLPVVRNAINGPTPLGVIDAPTEGTGKSLLAEVIALATVGEMPQAMSPDMPDDEWRKMLLASLLEGQPIMFLDNANRKLDSGALASALTAPFIRGRILGETRMAQACVNTCWLLTANNLICSREIARRVYSSRIDARVETPSTRTGFRHPQLTQWVKENRGMILWSVLVLVQNWRAAGGGWGSATLGKFEAWAGVMSGILEAAGITGFMGNADAFRAQATDQAGELAEFVAEWHKRYGTEPKIAGELYGIAEGTLESVLTKETEAGKRRQLGWFLKKICGRVVGDHRITSGKADNSDRARYKLEPRTKKAPGTDCDEIEVSG